MIDTQHCAPCITAMRGPSPFPGVAQALFSAQLVPRLAGAKRPPFGGRVARRARSWFGCLHVANLGGGDAFGGIMRRIAVAVLAACCWLQSGLTSAASEFKIVTASPRGTYIQIGRDIASFVAPSADIDLEVLPSAGSAENVRRLRYEPGVKFAIVQSDVYQAFLDEAARGNAEAGNIIRPLRVIMPLYNEEIYFIVRADSELNFVHEIKDARISAGELGSGTALTTTTLYRLMFDRSIPEATTSFQSNESALSKLVTDKTVDVVSIIAGQPAKVLLDMQPGADRLIKLLKFDAKQPASKAALRTYFATSVRATNYPNLLAEDLPALAVKAFLVTYDYNLKQTRDSLSRFARSICENFTVLQAKGHPKWSEVLLALPELGRGWFYYTPTAKELRTCIAGRAKTDNERGRTCSQQERILGLCS